MGNDNMVQNQKVFIRLEKVLELQRLLTDMQLAYNKHNSLADHGINKEAEKYALEASHHLSAMHRVIALLELPITL
jgi:hypothetical protein